MKASWLIVDGYSLIHRDKRFTRTARLAGIRQLLIRQLEGVAGFVAERITVVFDGRETNQGPESHSSQIE
ncbi:MAG: NYN domain-containing protein, partial [Lentisphaerota bacterium]